MIQYMHQKLQAIINEQSSEKILVSTANHELQQLLIAMNALLDHNQKYWRHIGKWKAL